MHTRLQLESVCLKCPNNQPLQIVEFASGNNRIYRIIEISDRIHKCPLEIYNVAEA